jgi:hypothetical protein
MGSARASAARYNRHHLGCPGRLHEAASWAAHAQRRRCASGTPCSYACRNSRRVGRKGLRLDPRPGHPQHRLTPEGDAEVDARCAVGEVFLTMAADLELAARRRHRYRHRLGEPDSVLDDGGGSAGPVAERPAGERHGEHACAPPRSPQRARRLRRRDKNRVVVAGLRRPSGQDSAAGSDTAGRQLSALRQVTQRGEDVTAPALRRVPPEWCTPGTPARLARADLTAGIG